MNIIELDDAITSHLEGWAPTLLIGDNLPSQTTNEKEFIRISTVYGDGFLDESTGIYDVRGSTTVNVFLLQFDVYVKNNSGRKRALELCQSIKDHWQIKQLGDGTATTSAADPDLIGEESPHYKIIVRIPGRFEEFLN